MSNQQADSYLFHYTPPVELGPSPVLLLLRDDGTVNPTSLRELSEDSGRVITYSFSLLVDWFRKELLSLPEQVVDLGVAKKLVVGRPKSDFSGDYPWDTWRLIETYLPARDKSPHATASLTTHLASPKRGAFGNLRLNLTELHALKRVWDDVCSDLERLGEGERFFTVEVPIFNLMLRSQYAGIRVDEERRNAFIEELEESYIRAYHALSIRHGINVERALHDSEYLCESVGIPETEWTKSLPAHEIVHYFKDVYEICNLLDELYADRRNKGILMRTFSCHSAMCYPIFDTMGTVTGRVLTEDPHLQHLKKRYRAMLVPRDDKQFLYLDYSQFEPNIIACLSGDPTLLFLCRDGHLYEELAQRIFGSQARRDDAKHLFLAYSYGMDEAGMIRIVSQCTGDDALASEKVRTEFMGMMAGVEDWKQQIHQELTRTGRIGTLLGNYRYRTCRDDLSAKEKGWALSQVVQGTGALILKRLILEIAESMPEVQVLLPMHDALLMELCAGEADFLTPRLALQFQASFSKVCPGVDPRVTIESFAS
jgi:hypothetical protein